MNNFLKILILLATFYIGVAFANNTEPALTSLNINGTMITKVSISTSVSVLAGTNVTATGNYINCVSSEVPQQDENPIVKWYRVYNTHNEQIGTGNSISFVANTNGNYMADFYCKDVNNFTYHALSFSIALSEDTNNNSNGEGGGGGGGYVYHTSEEGTNYDISSIEYINMNLYVYDTDTENLILYWNNLGYDGQVYYMLEYSTDKDFKSIKYRFETTANFYQISRQFIDTQVNYFRVRAGFRDKKSNYSNIIKYYTDDYLKWTCRTPALIDFDDVFLSTDVLLDGNFIPIFKCPNCNIFN